MDYWSQEKTEQVLQDNAIVLMAMADDLGKVEFILEEKEEQTYTFTREQVNEICQMDVVELRSDKNLFKEKLLIK